jgi:hypothetical protein
MKSVFSAATKRTKTSTIAIILADSFFFIISDPTHLSAPFMIFGFLLLGLTIYLLCRLAARVMCELGLISSPKRWAVAVVSLFIYIMITLQAIGQLSLRDIAALVPLVAMAYFYFTRISSKPTDS